MFVHMFSKCFFLVLTSHPFCASLFSYFLHHQVLVFIIIAFLRVVFFNFIFEKTYSPLCKRVQTLEYNFIPKTRRITKFYLLEKSTIEIKISSRFKILIDIFFIVTYILNFLFSRYFSYIFHDFCCKTKISKFLKLFYF